MNDSKTSSRVYRLLLYWLFALAGAYLLVCVLLLLVQRRMQYFPSSGEVPVPQSPRYRDLEDVTLRTEDDLNVRAWYWPGSRPVTLVIFHGNAGHRGWGRLAWIESFHRRGLGVFILDYRGYGGSEGSPSEAGFYLDAEAAIRWLEERGAPNLVFLGESIGCGVAVEMAVRHKPAALIVQSGFSSAVDVGRRHYPFLPVGLLLKDRYENIEKIDKITCPSLFTHGERDRIIPIDLGERLYEKAPEPKEFVKLPGGHNDPPGREYFEKLDAFLKRRVEQDER